MERLECSKTWWGEVEEEMERSYESLRKSICRKKRGQCTQRKRWATIRQMPQLPGDGACVWILTSQLLIPLLRTLYFIPSSLISVALV